MDVERRRAGGRAQRPVAAVLEEFSVADPWLFRRTSYSLNTARAASPEGRGDSLNFIELSPGPRARAR